MMELYTEQNTPGLSQVPYFLFESHVLPSRPIYYFFKRIYDITLAILFLFVALPFGLLIALALWIDNPGAIFFRISYHHGDVIIPYIRFTEPLRIECQRFIDCIRDPLRSPLNQGERI